MIEELLFMKDLNDSEKLLFQSQFNQEKKNATTAILFALFLGGIGGHHFYMGKPGVGVLYLLFFWTFIPAMVAFVELFLLSGRVENYNKTKAMEIALGIKALRTTDNNSINKAA